MVANTNGLHADVGRACCCASRTVTFSIVTFYWTALPKLNLRVIVSFGFIVFMVTSFWQTNFYTEVGYAQLIQPRFVQGLGIALFFAPLITIIISSLRPEDIATAMGMSNFFRILGGSFRHFSERHPLGSTRSLSSYSSLCPTY